MLRTLLKFRNLDLTKDINDRYVGLIKAGIFDGGNVTPVPNQLKVDIQAPWKLVNKEGMVVEETSDYTRLETPAGQVTYIAIKAIYYENKNPDISFHAIEKSAFESAIDREDYISFCSVNVPVDASSVLSSYIQFSDRDIVDKIGRDIVRGYVTDKAFLPSAKDNKAGDLWSVADGLGNTDAPPHIYGWNGTSWIVLTDSASIARDLANHRANLFTDEKHLTDLEKEAMSDPDGHRTSGMGLSRDNPIVDWNDPRIPTQNENDALVGAGLSTSIPSSINRYIFEEYPWAVPTEISYQTPNSDVIQILSSDDALNEFGLVFVGVEQQTQVPATRFFRLYHSTKNREYVKDADGLGIYITGVYTDSNCTIPVDSQQAIDPMVDDDGFFIGNNTVDHTLYLKCSGVPDSDFRLVYLKRQLMTRGIEDNNSRTIMPTNAFLNRNPESAQIAYDVIEKVENVKGRLWDDLVPTNESNIELRKDIVDLKEYVSSVFMADHVVSDFSKVEGVPDFLGHFVKNIGIPNYYKYENVSLVGFAYTRDTGTITYFSPIDTSGITIGSDVFVDSNLNEFIISQIVDTQNIKILKRSGSIPVTVGTSVTSTVYGSVKTDNNPRQINLALLQTLVGRERISCREVEIIPNEFHPVTNNIAFQIRTPLHSAFFKENRVRFYGGFQNIGEGNRSQVVLTGKGRILITGFFSDLYLLTSLSSGSPSTSVILDGGAPSTLDLSTQIPSIFDKGFEVRQQYVKLCEGASSDIPHTVELIIDDAADPFIVYGFDLINKNVDNIKILSGRAFVQSDLYKQDSITSATTTSCALRTRGVVDTKYINRNLVVSSKTTTLSDFDGALPPTGSVTGSDTFEVSGSLNKFKNYSNGDIVKLITATSETILRINTIVVTTNTVITFYSAIPFALGTVGMLVHVASTTTESQDAIREYNRFTTTDLSSRLLIDLFTDPTLPTKIADRIFTVEDGTTSLVAKNVRFITTGIDGMDTALELVDNTSFIRIRAVASQLCLLLSNIADTSAQFSIDGCPLYDVSIAGGGLLNLMGWSNARYQTHEIYITNAAGTKFSGFILYEPTHSTKIEGSLLGTQNLIADYIPSSGTILSTGVIAVDPYIMGGVFVGNGWSYDDFNFSMNDKWGRYISTAQQDDYFEYTFLGSGIEVEYIAANDCGKPYIYLNGNLVTTTNFPGVNIVGIVAGTVDMYSATTVRRKFSITGLLDSTDEISDNMYTLSIKLSNPPLRNVASAGFVINVDTIYEANSSGKLCYTPSLGYKRKDGMGDFCYGFDWVRDERNFDTGAIIKEEVPVTRTIIQETRSQRVKLSENSTEITVYLTKAFDDTKYAIPCTIENTTDGYPCFIPLVIKKKDRTYFTIAWNQPLDSDNYYLNYTAVKYI